MTFSRKPGPGEIIYSWLMLPVYAWQGFGVRNRTHRMPPPEHDGYLEHQGQGEPIQVLVIGDSSAAGVGVEHIESSFAGFLPRFINERSGRAVRVRIVGLNSATAAQIRDFAIPNIAEQHFDYIALNIGTNDAKNFHTGRRFCRDFGTLIYALKTRFPGGSIIWSGVLNLATVPALPSPLNRILGIRSRLIDHNGRRLCRERGALAPPSEWEPRQENFSPDGFHASEEGYRAWAQSVANYIVELESSGKDTGGDQRHANVG